MDGKYFTLKGLHKIDLGAKVKVIVLNHIRNVKDILVSSALQGIHVVSALILIGPFLTTENYDAFPIPHSSQAPHLTCKKLLQGLHHDPNNR